MAQRTISTKLAVSGEKEYKSAITNINNSLGVLNSELKKTTAEYADNADSVEALTKKGDVLERTLLTQKEKVEELRKALANAQKEYGEADNRTLAWQKSLNLAEASVYNTEQAIKENNEALNNSKESMTGLGTMLDGLTQKFGISLPSGITESLDSIGSFSTGAVAALGAVAVAVTAVVKGYQKLIDMTRESAAYADNVLTLSQITGIDTESIQELQYAAELIDVSFDTIKDSLKKLKSNMQSAAEGNNSLSETFTKLGVSVTDADGNLRNAEDVFYELIDALGEVENVTERDADAMDLFGKSADELNPLIVQGSDTLKEYCDEAEDVNAVLNGESLAALGAVDDAYQRLQTTQEGITNQMSAQMAPAVEELYTTWTQFIQEAGQALIDSGILKNLGNILENITAIIAPVDSLSENSIPGLTSAFKALSDILGGVSLLFAAIADAADVIKSIFTLDWTGFTNALGFGYSSGSANNIQTTLMKQNGTYEQYSSYYASKYNAPGDVNYSGGWTVVGENGPEMVNLPSGSSIYTNQDSRNLGGDVFNFTIDASSIKELNDLVRIAQNSRMSVRMRG